MCSQNAFWCTSSLPERSEGRLFPDHIGSSTQMGTQLHFCNNMKHHKQCDHTLQQQPDHMLQHVCNNENICCSNLNIQSPPPVLMVFKVCNHFLAWPEHSRSKCVAIIEQLLWLPLYIKTCLLLVCGAQVLGGGSVALLSWLVFKQFQLTVGELTCVHHMLCCMSPVV